MLAADPNCFSRFMITPKRQGVAPGGKAIASASACAFGGFLSESFRRHDFFLGRANCQAYLRRELVLPVENSLFTLWRSKATDLQIQQMTVNDKEGRSCHPLIPLFGACREDESTEPYPKGVVDLDSAYFQDALDNRLDKLLEHLKDDLALHGILGFFEKIGLSLGVEIGHGALRDKVTEWLKKNLGDWGLT
jgi:hypothetical protein